MNKTIITNIDPLIYGRISESYRVVMNQNHDVILSAMKIASKQNLEMWMIVTVQDESFSTHYTHNYHYINKKLCGS